MASGGYMQQAANVGSNITISGVSLQASQPVFARLAHALEVLTGCQAVLDEIEARVGGPRPTTDKAGPIPAGMGGAALAMELGSRAQVLHERLTALREALG